MQIFHYTNPAGELRVGCEYSEPVVAVWRSLGGLFDGANKEWVFRDESRGRVMQEIERLFGLEEDDPVMALVCSGDMASGDGSFRGWTDGAQVMLGGYVLATRRGRDQHAKILAPLRDGLIPVAGGSVKRPAVSPSPNTVFAIEVRRDFAEANGLTLEDASAVAQSTRPKEEYRAGKHLLELDLPGGSALGTASAVRTIVLSMTDGAILKSLRIASP